MNRKSLILVAGHAGSGKDHLATRFCHSHVGWRTVAMSNVLLEMLDVLHKDTEQRLGIETGHNSFADSGYRRKADVRGVLQSLGSFLVVNFGGDILARLASSKVERFVRRSDVSGVWVTGVRRAAEADYFRQLATDLNVEVAVMGIGSGSRSRLPEAEFGIDDLLDQADIRVSSPVSRFDAKGVDSLIRDVRDWVEGRRMQTEFDYGIPTEQHIGRVEVAGQP